ncbi:hypothetical protein N7533_003749 [Penicillium manginii]|uniref:uncharacterized protein n=1 Tax=Penicillium manginii TaxID=203109 RepID=UPI002548B79F|nr:uncharacterized protein N7533_011667 [Penicillium manginii]XP_056960029.1 uncharacterized protein N7533_003749 [Penicillium manginii]KAJ5742258.1 hypothetical protein N7533_011667 [Penicillium manginii]KAJ5754206.1 hypothetical protein N7533_003749 [Penicillium manginii]
MPAGRPQVNMEPYKDQIIVLLTQKTPINVILDMLHQKNGLQISPRTFKRRTQAWGIQRRAPTGITNNRPLQIRVETLICEGNLSPKEILEVLARDGTPISNDSLKQIRRRLGIRLHIDDKDEQRQQEDEILEVLKEEQGFGLIEGSRGAYKCPGPNFVWHIDGYMKLEPYGIEIYAAIDGYSRYVTWFYVGISTRTSFSVLRQYIDTLSATGFQPRTIRSDLGTETMLIADAHYALRKAIDIDPMLQFSDCFWYGRSVQNQRIESWWGQLTSSMNFVWRELFIWLQDQGHFQATIPDQIALLAVYMPSIKDTCAEFVLTWNSHRIRKQKGRPYSVPGKPWMNYYYPGQDTDGQDIKDYQHTLDPAMLSAMRYDVDGWDADEYLPRHTMEWRHTQLLQMQFDPERPPVRDGTRPYVEIYLRLRERAVYHTQIGAIPILSLCEKPTMSSDWA